MLILLNAILPMIIFYHIGTMRHRVSATKCVVSRWRPWSDCAGSCEFGQRFRNRDVVRAPFPERDNKTGEFVVLRECPRLYEVERCVPKECNEDESPFVKIPLVGFNKGRSTNRNESGESVAKNDKNRTKIWQNKNRIAENNDGEDPFATKRKKLAGTSIRTAPEKGPECPFSNPGCCKVVRLKCPPDGTKPISLIRWYRKKDEHFCRSYRYPFCAELSTAERTFVTENECLEGCFSEVEKAVLPGFRIL